MKGATAEQFAQWRKHAQGLTIDSLEYIVKDCAEARDAMAGHNPDRECFYADQYFTYLDELRQRRDDNVQ